MPHTLVAFLEDIDLANTLQPITAAPDQHVYYTGDDIRVPTLNQVVAVAAGLASGGTQVARLTAPSLRPRGHVHVMPCNGGADADVEPDADENVYDLRRTPVVLVTGEMLNAELRSDTTAAADQWMLVWLSSGPIAAVEGNIQTISLTGATTVTARTWSTCALTPETDLEAGTYEVVGMRYLGASAIAGRLILTESPWRPGVIGCDDPQDLPHSIFRHGRFGSFGTFRHDTPPQLEALCDLADTAQSVYLDVIKR